MNLPSTSGKNNKIAENADCKVLQGALEGADVCMKNLSQRNFLESNGEEKTLVENRSFVYKL